MKWTVSPGWTWYAMYGWPPVLAAGVEAAGALALGAPAAEAVVAGDAAVEVDDAGVGEVWVGGSAATPEVGDVVVPEVGAVAVSAVTLVAVAAGGTPVTDVARLLVGAAATGAEGVRLKAP
jgi:hypothetical protein